MRNMWDNKPCRLILAIALSAAMVLGMAGCGMCVAGADDDNKTENAVSSEFSEQTETVVSGAPAEDGKVSSGSEETGVVKKETVYVLADADGTSNKVIVSDWLSGSAGNEAVTDVSDLTDIEVVKGNSTMTEDGAKKVWNVSDGDVYYRGNSNAEVPVAVHVTYFLDGKEISAKDIAGKSGTVTIRFDYENRKSETVMIDGTETTVYVPFVMITGALLDSETFSNVSVTNGRLVNDGSRMAVVGWAFPGLAEDLGISGEDISVPDFVEITADVKNFSMGMTLTIATNEVFRGLNVGKLDSLSKVDEILAQITDAMTKLENGSDALYEGLCTLLDSTDALSEGAGKLADGSKQLADGAKKASDGAGQLADGASTLDAGLSKLDANSEALREGAKEVFNSLLSEAQQQLTAAGLTIPTLTIDNYETVLDNVISTLDKDAVYRQAEEEVKKLVEAKRGYIEEQVTAAVRSEVEKAVTDTVRSEVAAKVVTAVEAKVRAQVEEAVKAQVFAKVLSAAGMTQDTYEAGVAAGMIDKATQEQLNAATEAQMNSAEVKGLIESTVVDKMGSDEVSKSVEAAVDEQMRSNEITAIISKTTEDKLSSAEIRKTISENTQKQIDKAIADAMNSDEVKTKLAAAEAGVVKIGELKQSLNEYRQFYEGLKAYTDGVSQAAEGADAVADGAKQLEKGTADLASGAEELHKGDSKLRDGIPALKEGIRQLRDGAQALSDGIGEFDREAVQKIVALFDGNVETLIDRVKAIASVTDTYDNYSGIADGMSGEVKFIIRTAEIGE